MKFTGAIFNQPLMFRIALKAREFFWLLVFEYSNGKDKKKAAKARSIGGGGGGRRKTAAASNEERKFKQEMVAAMATTGTF